MDGGGDLPHHARRRDLRFELGPTDDDAAEVDHVFDVTAQPLRRSADPLQVCSDLLLVVPVDLFEQHLAVADHRGEVAP